MNVREVLQRALSECRTLAAAPQAPAGARSSFDLIAVGKGAAAAADGILEGSRGLAAGLVVLPDDAAPPKEHPRLLVLRASHPLPDERSVATGEAALALAREGEGSELLVHVSGGASSLIAAPIDGLALEALRAVTRALLSSGADVRAINVVRRHMSRAHGGALARAAWPRATTARIVSDVIDGAPHDVGSGPASPDPTTVADARASLARCAPSFCDLPLAETLKPFDREAARVSSSIDVEPRLLAELVARDLASAGYSARVLPASTEEVTQLAADYAKLALTLAPGEALVRCAEPRVRVDVVEPGRGGRCTHLAALVARELAARDAGVAFLAAASDGLDGSSETGGALVDARAFVDRRSDLAAAIAAFDTGTFHRAHGTALPCGPTGLNFADLHVLLRAREP